MVGRMVSRGASVGAATFIAAVALAFTSLPATASTCGASGDPNPCTFQGVTFSLTDLGGGELQVTFSPATGTSIDASATGDWAGIHYLEAFALKPNGGTYTGASLASWSFMAGGLSNGASDGCNGSGSGFVCFYQPTTPFTIPATGSMTFDVFFTGGTVDLSLAQPI